MRLKHWSVIPAPPPRPTLIPAGDLQHTLWEDALTALKQLLQLWRNDAQDSVNTKAAPTFSQLERRPRHLCGGRGRSPFSPAGIQGAAYSE